MSRSASTTWGRPRCRTCRPNRSSTWTSWSGRSPMSGGDRGPRRIGYRWRRRPWRRGTAGLLSPETSTSRATIFTWSWRTTRPISTTGCADILRSDPEARRRYGDLKRHNVELAPAISMCTWPPRPGWWLSHSPKAVKSVDCQPLSTGSRNSMWNPHLAGNWWGGGEWQWNSWSRARELGRQIWRQILRWHVLNAPVGLDEQHVRNAAPRSHQRADRGSPSPSREAPRRSFGPTE